MFDSIQKIIAAFIALMTVLSSALFTNDIVEPTPLENREYSDGELTVEPDTEMYLNVNVLDEGTDIYAPSTSANYGYRYGPSIFINADGSIDAWFAAPGTKGQWDWITYRHSPDGGTSWTDEVAVLKPTPGSDDFYSCCDPGAVKIGDYYYIGYTSTTDLRGVDNNVFVARSLDPAGPYEKWTGSGWGIKPEAIVHYDENPDDWGAGEPSFVVLGDKLFVYYTWKSRDAQGVPVNETRVAVADATDENWPATMEQIGTAIVYPDGGCDSADVKYIEDYGKFIAISTSVRMSENSYVSIYESNDGYVFTKVNDLKTNIGYFCHNSGISSRPNGHIRLSDRKYIAYAYGPEWGNWSTRMHKIRIELVATPDFSDSANSNAKRDIVKWSSTHKVYVGITEEKHDYTLKVGEKLSLDVFKVDTNFSISSVFNGVTVTGFDSSVISASGRKITALAVGSTYAYVECDGMRTLVLITVAE